MEGAVKFYEKAQQMKYTERMNKETTEIFIKSTMAEAEMFKKEKKHKLLMEEDIERLPFPLQILHKRIEVMDLPINFTLFAALAMASISEGNPGRIVSMLVDCLTKHPNEVVDISKLAELYPFGYYNEETFIDYVDNYLKPRKVEWAEVYGSR